MKIFVDENIPLLTVRALLEEEHDVLDIRGTADKGMEDDILWHMIQGEERLLITTDKGFTRYRNTSGANCIIPKLTIEKAIITV